LPPGIHAHRRLRQRSEVAFLTRVSSSFSSSVILICMTHKVGAKGQVVIPKAIREELGIEPGDEVIFEPDDKDVRIRRLADDAEERKKRIKALRGIWADTPGGGTDALLEERRKEREREERKAQRWGVGRP
jgi:AbrB family looped-hinge helix DNA binding protein